MRTFPVGDKTPIFAAPCYNALISYIPSKGSFHTSQKARGNLHPQASWTPIHLLLSLGNYIELQPSTRCAFDGCFESLFFVALRLLQQIKHMCLLFLYRIDPTPAESFWRSRSLECAQVACFLSLPRSGNSAVWSTVLLARAVAVHCLCVTT